MSASSTHNRLSDTVHYATDSSKEFVSDHPMSTTLAAFGLGLGLGVAIVYLMGDGASQRHNASLAHRVGRRVLDSLGYIIPDSLTHSSR